MKRQAELSVTSGKEAFVVQVRSGLGLEAIALKHDLPLEFDCRKADCGICIVNIVQGMDNLQPPDNREKDFLQAMHASPTERLGCQLRIYDDLKIEIENFGPDD